MPRSPKVLYVIPQFPKLTETAVMNELRLLLALGVDVLPAALGRGDRHVRVPGPIKARLKYLPGFGWWGGWFSPVARSLALAMLYPHVSASVRSVMKERHVPSRFTAGVRALTDYAREQGANVMHVQFGNAARLCAPAAMLAGVPLVTSFRGWDAHAYPLANPGIYRGFFDVTALNLVRCQSMGRRLVRLGCDPAKLRVHHSGVDVENIPFKPERPAPSGGPFRLLLVGRLVDKKGVPAAIGAVRRCLDDGLNVELRVIGDGPKREDIEQLLENIEVEDSVQLLGARDHDDVIREMHECHIFVLPCKRAWDGDREGIPNAIMEAMAAGMPVISTVHEGIPECVEHGKSGLLVKERDVPALAEAIKELCARPEAWRPMAEAARRKIESDFNARVQAEKLKQIYEEVIS